MFTNNVKVDYNPLKKDREYHRKTRARSTNIISVINKWHDWTYLSVFQCSVFILPNFICFWIDLYVINIYGGRDTNCG